MVRFIFSYFEFYSSVVTNGYLFTRIIFLHTMFYKYTEVPTQVLLIFCFF